MKLGGNKTIKLQKATYTVDDIGEQVVAWTDYKSIQGFLDMLSGTSRWNTYGAQVTEATHVFICDYADALLLLDPSLLHAVVDGQDYDVLYIDNPVGSDLIVEIYLKRVGIDNG